MTCSGRGVSLEQRTHRPVVSQSFVVTWHFVRGLEDAAHCNDARNCAQRYRPVAFATEGLRVVLCFAFNCGIRAKTGWMQTWRCVGLSALLIANFTSCRLARRRLLARHGTLRPANPHGIANRSRPSVAPAHRSL